MSAQKVLPFLFAALIAFGAVPIPTHSEARAQDAELLQSATSEVPQSFCQPPLREDAEPICIGVADFTADVCRAITSYADAYGLPEGFFARLIWQESRFDPAAISPAGAEGIAQFMPGTARMRGLANSFDPAEALARSAQYLRVLELKFGNLGLAAAAYNSGEGRTRSIRRSGGVFPSETRAFVRIITGIPVEQWLGSETQVVDYALRPDKPFHEACLDMASAVRTPDFIPAQADWRPWGVQLAQFFSPEVAQSAFFRLRGEYPGLLGEEKLMIVSGRNPAFGPRIRHSAMIGRDTRADAEALCAALRAAGASCIVRNNE